MLLLLLSSLVHAGTIFEDLDACVTQPEIRPYVENLALGPIESPLSATRAELALEIVRRSKARCVGEVMNEHLGKGFPRYSGYGPHARTVLANAELYAGVKRAEMNKQRCKFEFGQRCHFRDIVAHHERLQFNNALREFFETLERETPQKTIDVLYRERLATYDRRIMSLEGF